MEINEVENKKTMEKINKNISCFFKINKVVRPMAPLTKKKEKT